MNRKNDIPLPLAVLLLLLVLFGLYIFSVGDLNRQKLELVGALFTQHWCFLSLLFISVSINLCLVVYFFKRKLGLSGQGAKLRRLIKNVDGKKDGAGHWQIGLVFFLGSLWLIHMAARTFTFQVFWDLQRLGMEVGFYEAGFLCITNFYCTVFASLKAIQLNIPFDRLVTQKAGSELANRPKKTNEICLGMVNEENDENVPRERKPEWVSLNRRALNGNILVTGSIGSGKTSGTILPYIQQILQNFSPTPSMLLIDPKGTFLAEARKIMGELNFKDNILHIHMDGDVTFNPIYVENALRGAKFQEVAQMIRAAAINFMGKDFDGKFWEISAFNLTRNALIYCAAVKGYYTLKDLYEVLMAAGDDRIWRELIDVKRLNSQKCEQIREIAKELGGKSLKEADVKVLTGEINEQSQKIFLPEELHNIDCAIQYFKEEFGQLEAKVRTSILATSTSFLNQFQEYRAARIFCPKKENLTVRSMDDLVDSGQIVLFDITSPALARSMGTFIKLHYQQALLNRLANPDREKNVSGVIVIDEYQDVVTVSSGTTIGDEKCLAKGREANIITIAATQSYSTLENAVNNTNAAKELIQNFRTRIACHSSDEKTIRSFQELAGKSERSKTIHNISEMSQHASRNYLLGGFDAKDANITESYSTTPQKDYEVTGREFSALKSFEAFGFVYNGVETMLKKLYLKPHFLEKPHTRHQDVLKMLASSAAALMVFFFGPNARAFPNVCSVVKTPEFKSCLDFKVSGAMCGWPVPRPCARISYWVPQTFIEVHPNPGETYFKELFGTRFQLATVKNKTPFGVEADNDTQSYHSHVLSVPFAQIPFSLLPCGGTRLPKLCFDAMSEHVSEHWATGKGDLLQPLFLAWSASPKACLMAGALSSATGGSGTRIRVPDSPMCSVPLPKIAKYLTFQPSTHPACNGWGTFYPRSGTYNGPASLTGSLMIASRMKSIASEVFRSAPSETNEKWQMISPQSSSCFREGQNMGVLELGKNVRELGRLRGGGLKGNLFVIWKQVSCKQEWPAVPAFYAAIEAMSAVCRGL